MWCVDAVSLSASSVFIPRSFVFFYRIIRIVIGVVLDPLPWCATLSPGASLSPLSWHGTHTSRLRTASVFVHRVMRSVFFIKNETQINDSSAMHSSTAVQSDNVGKGHKGPTADHETDRPAGKPNGHENEQTNEFLKRVCSRRAGPEKKSVRTTHHTDKI